MSLKIKTTKLQEMVSRAIKGASNNKMIPLTGLMFISLAKKKLTLTTTDATNYLYIVESKVEGEDFNVTVPVDIFSKLISKLTCENVELNINEEDSVLEVIGNGSYLIELPTDEEGQPIKYPDPVGDMKLGKSTETGEINLSTVQAILTTAKPSLATTTDVPCYMGYYMGDDIVTTDTVKLCDMQISVFGTPKLISSEQMNLLSVMEAEKIKVHEKDNILVYVSPDCTVYGPTHEGIDEFNIEAIKNLMDTKFDSKCKLPKDAVLQVLDRLSLFVEDYEKNAIHLTFTKEGLQISSMKSSGIEVIKYLESDNFKDYICAIDIECLQSQIKALVGDSFELSYGDSNALKITEGNVTLLICLLDENE